MFWNRSPAFTGTPPYTEQRRRGRCPPARISAAPEPLVGPHMEHGPLRACHLLLGSPAGRLAALLLPELELGAPALWWPPGAAPPEHWRWWIG